nr:hypothetical protein [Actinomycetales bacterium]
MKRWIVGSLAAGSAVAGLTGAVLAWQKGPGVRRVNESIAEFTDHWEGVVASNAGGDGVIQFVALGDSSVQGVGASSPESSWVSVLAERIEERTGRPVEIYNLSVSGAIAAEVLREQIPRMREFPFEPDLVMLAIGGNDATQPQRVTVESYAQVMSQIVKLLPRGSFITDPPWISIPLLGSRARRMARQVRPLIQEYGHHLLPLFDATHSAGRLRYFSYTSEDRFHPNDAAYVLWAEGFLAALTEAGWAPRIA